ncbi:MAG: flagellar biosynthetic protein FliR [Lachnospiraceae bacterium]|nr:flagellar biosynthetic protein FliR [Lachnospiraceae bacterium]
MLDYSFTYGDFELFILVLVRVTSFAFVAPFFSMNNTPRPVKIGLSFFITVLLFNVIPHDPLSYGTLLEYFGILVREVLTGLLIGLGANLCTMIVNFAGHIADMEVGLSMVSLMDPATRNNVTITGVYYNYMVMMMLLISGMHRYLISALAETYTLIPINGQVFHDNKLISAFIEFMGEYMLIGFRICLPIFAVMIILNAVLGILAKISPQLNMFAVGIQIKVLTGLAILLVSTSMLPDAADLIFKEMKHMVVTMVEALS